MYLPITGTGDGSAPAVNLTWPFLDPEDVQATVNGSPATLAWTGAAQVTFASPVTSGATWSVYRNTSLTAPAVDFTDGSVLTEADLDKAHAQLRYALQESFQDGAGGDTGFRNDLAGPLGPSYVSFSQSGAYNAGTVGKKLQQIKAVPDYADHATADALGLTLYVPADVTSTRANATAILSNHWGPGRVTTADGNKRGKLFSHLAARPSRAVFTDHDSVDTSFNGDWSHAQLVVEYWVTGAATLGQPTTGYLETPEASPYYIALDNTSGWNNATGSNVGRTGLMAFYANIKQRGQGDVMGYHASIDVNAARAGATHFLANPAGAVLTGEVFASQPGVYLQGSETDLDDQGFDVAGISDVRNLTRTVGTGALSATWLAFRLQSNGSQPVDAMLSAIGKWKGGIDFSPATLDLGANKAAILFKPDQKVYLNASSSNGYFATTPGTDFFGYSSTTSGLEFTLGGSVRLRVRSNGVLELPGFHSLPSYASDSAAATGGVAVDQLYRNGSTLSVRVA